MVVVNFPNFKIKDRYMNSILEVCVKSVKTKNSKSLTQYSERRREFYSLVFKKCDYSDQNKYCVLARGLASAQRDPLGELK